MPRKSFTINGNNLPKTQWVGGSVGGFVWRCSAVMHVTEKEETIEGNLLNGCAACSGQSVGFFGDWGMEYGDRGFVGFKTSTEKIQAKGNIKTRNVEQSRNALNFHFHRLSAMHILIKLINRSGISQQVKSNDF